MKILMVRANYAYPDSRCEKELFSLGKRHEVEILGWDRSADCKFIRQSELEINQKKFTYRHIGVKAPSGLGFRKMFFPLLRFWRREIKFLKKEAEKYDAIHFCDFDAAFPLFFMRKKNKTVYDIFDYYADAHPAPKLISSFIRYLENRIILKSDAVIICSEARKAQILPAEPKNLTVVHNTPMDISATYDRDETPPSAESGVLKVVYVGSLINGRFILEMIDVIAGRSDVELHIGGFGCLEEEITRLAGMHSNIIFYGKVNYSDTLVLERRCDVMTAIYDPRIPNHKYAAPNKFYESLMLKKPLIMIRDTGMDFYVEKYRLGEVIDGNAESFKKGFSDALDNLIAQKEHWSEMGERGHRLYREQFSWDEMEKRLFKIYDGLE